jgi:hypothetical protein
MPAVAKANDEGRDIINKDAAAFAGGKFAGGEEKMHWRDEG